MTRQFLANLALCSILGALAIFSVTQVGSVLTPKGLFMSKPSISHDAEKMLQDVILANYRIVKSTKNSMVEANFNIRNNSVHSVKNVSIICDFEDENKNHNDREVWKIGEKFPAKHQVNVTSVSKRYINTKAKASACFITDFQLIRKPAFTLKRHVSKGHEQDSKKGNGAQPPSGH